MGRWDGGWGAVRTAAVVAIGVVLLGGSVTAVTLTLCCLSDGGAAALWWVMAVRIITLRSVFGLYTGPADENVLPTGATAYHYYLGT